MTSIGDGIRIGKRSGLRLGPYFSLGGGMALNEGVGGGTPPADGTTVLSWSGDQSDATANLTATLYGWVGGDILEWEVDTSPSFTSVVEDDQEAVFGSPFEAETTGLSNGTYYARARMVRGGTPFAWSNTVTITIALPYTRIDSATVRIDSPSVRIDA